MGSRKDVDRIYQAMDVFVLPSRYEGLPVVAVEAQAAGLPCVLSDQITEEIDLSELITFESIDQKASVWAENVLQVSHTVRNCNISEALRDCFDIYRQGCMLENYYLNVLGKEGIQ